MEEGHSGKMAGATGLEPATSAVTGQRSNQLSYAPARTGSQNVCQRPLARQPVINPLIQKNPDPLNYESQSNMA